MKKYRTKDIIDLLENAGVTVDDYTAKRDGTIIIRKGFFYTNGYTADKYRDSVLMVFPHADIIEHGEHWMDFKSNAPTKKQSHWYVQFILPQ